MDKNIADIEDLLTKPLWQMSGKEYVFLHSYACTFHTDTRAPQLTKIKGTKALAEHLDCSESMVYSLRRKGVLDDAIISRVGKRIVFDGDKAQELAQAYIQESRKGKAMK